MKSISIFSGWSLMFACLLLLSGCDKIEGVAMDGANNLGKVIQPVAKAVLGPSDERVNAETICMNAVTARYPGRHSSVYRSNIEGSNKFFIDVMSFFTPKENAAVQRRVANGEISPLYATDYVYVECYTDNGVVTRISER
ncbi:MAG: hypothetical protein ACYC2E_04225 [Sulfuricella sp.]